MDDIIGIGGRSLTGEEIGLYRIVEIRAVIAMLDAIIVVIFRAQQKMAAPARERRADGKAEANIVRVTIFRGAPPEPGPSHP